MNAREKLVDALQNPGLVGYSKEEADELVDALLQEHATPLISETFRTAVELVRDNPSLLLPASAGPVRPDEEPTP